MPSGVFLARRIFEWISDGRAADFVPSDGHNRWIREQTGFIHILLGFMANMTLIFLWCLFGLGTEFALYLSIAILIVISAIFFTIRTLNKSRRFSLITTLNLLVWMMILLMLSMCAFVHICFGGLGKSGDNNVLFLTSLGPFAIMQVAGSYIPEEKTTKAKASTKSRARDRGRRKSISSLDSDEEYSDLSSEDGGFLSKRMRAVAQAADKNFTRQLQGVNLLLISRAALVIALVAVDEGLPVIVDRPLAMTLRNHNVLDVFIVLTFVLGIRGVAQQSAARQAQLEGVVAAAAAAQRNAQAKVTSLVPGFFGRGLVNSSPRRWCRRRPTRFGDCSIVQMDLVGYTSMSSCMEPEELVKLLNCLFTEIDRAAYSVGQYWKTETVGDCWCAVIGGPYPVPDHAGRAIRVACRVLAAVARVAARCQVRESVCIAGA